MSQIIIKLQTVILLCACAAHGLATDDRTVNNPVYTNWSGFPVGTMARYEQTTRAGTFEEVRVLTYELKEKSAEKLTVEITTFVAKDGEESATSRTQTAKRYFRLPEGTSKEEFGSRKNALSGGAETVELIDRKFDTKWIVSQVKVEAGTTESRIWCCPDVPGGLVKSVSKTPATSSVTTVTLMEIRTINKP